MFPMFHDTERFMISSPFLVAIRRPTVFLGAQSCVGETVLGGLCGFE